MKTRRLLSILWPAFLVAGILEILIFIGHICLLFLAVGPRVRRRFSGILAFIAGGNMRQSLPQV